MAELRPKVLIVDDEPSILQSTAALLEELGYETATCERAQDIPAAVSRDRPDVILQDVRMPGLDLEALIAELRASPAWRATPIVIFTASMDLDEVVQRVGAVAKLDKPFKPHELARVLEQALGAKT